MEIRSHHLQAILRKLTLLCSGFWVVRPTRVGLAQPVKEEGERFDMPEAEAFRYRQRLNEDGTIPPNALMIALQDLQGMRARTAGLDSTRWSPIGPSNI